MDDPTSQPPRAPDAPVADAGDAVPGPRPDVVAMGLRALREAGADDPSVVGPALTGFHLGDMTYALYCAASIGVLGGLALGWALWKPPRALNRLRSRVEALEDELAKATINMPGTGQA